MNLDETSLSFLEKNNLKYISCIADVASSTNHIASFRFIRPIITIKKILLLYFFI